jgi:hypothetical protein
MAFPSTDPERVPGRTRAHRTVASDPDLALENPEFLVLLRMEVIRRW